MFDVLTFIFVVIGFLTFLNWLYDSFVSVILLIKSILIPYFQPSENLTLAKRYGNWAVVTGATDGIGKEYALNLASQQINIVLISRTKEKLIKVANEIESKFQVKTKSIEIDFSKGYEIYNIIKKELNGIPVGILVNNVGRMYDYPDEFGNVPEQLLWDILHINIASVTMLTRMFINDMTKNKKGAIVNISSGSELQPLPYSSVYGASKIFVKNFTLALQKEYKSSGITIQLITPLFVQTKMNYYSDFVMNGNICIPDSKSYSKFAVFTLGKTDRTTGYWTHGIQYALFKIFPERIRTIIGEKLNKSFRDEYLTKNNKKIK